MSNGQTAGKLNLFDVTNLVIGGAVGADIYVVASLGSAYLGPASLFVWVIAGAIAIMIALNFAEAAALVPRVGGSFAYACEAWGDFAGFLVGWPLWIAEIAALAVMPVAFVRYLTYFFPSLTVVQGAAIKVLFVAAIGYVNLRGAKAAGRANDVLTIAKLSPLLLLIVAGFAYLILHPGTAASNLNPFAPLGFGNFGQALVLIIWAYAGFELAVIPSGDVENPTKTIPKAMVIGMAIVTLFYVLTNFVVLATVNWTVLQYDIAPLATAGSVVLSYTPVLAVVGGAVLGIGALISVSGFDESGTLSTSRLSYAIAFEGLFPKLFSRLHPRFGTPYYAIIAQSAIALAASLIGDLTQLIVFLTFNVAFVYLATSASVLTLRERKEAVSEGTHLSSTAYRPYHPDRGHHIERISHLCVRDYDCSARRCVNFSRHSDLRPVRTSHRAGDAQERLLFDREDLSSQDTDRAGVLGLSRALNTEGDTVRSYKGVTEEGHL